MSKVMPNEEGTGYHITGTSTKSKPNGVWTRDDLMAFGANVCDKALLLAQAKNKDYARDLDPFRNLRRGGPFGIAVRMDDKVSRLLTLLEPGAAAAAVEDEPIEKTALDMLNYNWLLIALMEEQKGTP